MTTKTLSQFEQFLRKCSTERLMKYRIKITELISRRKVK